ncbi:hypothetical protein CEXT_731951 [Caerostris extrusa]|uniref:Uncharacterized protein n=1 Tax=Caerostris extrusa TaxID=172846 RepID=A0AAV4QD58_CAEEX|nr:hypothetical protein CEXT_731951 [Caerostris extrusa]
MTAGIVIFDNRSRHLVAAEEFCRERHWTSPTHTSGPSENGSVQVQRNKFRKLHWLSSLRYLKYQNSINHPMTAGIVIFDNRSRHLVAAQNSAVNATGLVQPNSIPFVQSF